MQQLNPFSDTLANRLISKRFYLEFEANCCLCHLFDVLLIDAHLETALVISIEKSCERTLVMAMKRAYDHMNTEDTESEFDESISTSLAFALMDSIKYDPCFCNSNPRLFLKLITDVGYDDFENIITMSFDGYIRMIRLYDYHDETFTAERAIEKKRLYAGMLASYAFQDIEILNMWLKWSAINIPLLFPTVKIYSPDIESYEFFYSRLNNGALLYTIEAHIVLIPDTNDVRVLDLIAPYIDQDLSSFADYVDDISDVEVCKWFIMRIHATFPENEVALYAQQDFIVKLSHKLNELEVLVENKLEFPVLDISARERRNFSHYHTLGATQFNQIIQHLVSNEFIALLQSVPCCDMNKIPFDSIALIDDEHSTENVVLGCKYFTAHQIEILLDLVDPTCRLGKYLTLLLEEAD